MFNDKILLFTATKAYKGKNIIKILRMEAVLLLEKSFLKHFL